METDRSPVQLLGDILDEVEGLRQVDPRSHLPFALLEAARRAVDDGSKLAPGVTMTGLHDVDDLVGRTIAHVFEGGDLIRGDVVLVCNDGGVLALKAEPDGEDAYISGISSARPLHELVRFQALARVGLMTQQQRDELDRKEREKRLGDARMRLSRATKELELAQAEVDKLQPPAPAAPAEAPA